MTATRTWGENVRPTPEQFADWFVAIPREERIERAAAILDAVARADDCFLRNHAGLAGEAKWAHRRAARYRTAWLSARRRIHPQKFLREWRRAMEATP